MAKQGKYTRAPEPKQRRSIFPRREKTQTPPPPEAQPPEVPLTPRQKLWSTVITVAVNTVMVLSVIVMLFTVISVRTMDQKDRDLFGYRFFIVRSDSMSATDFSAGDLVVVKEVDPTTLVEGDIIAFISQDPNTFGQTVTHMIRSVKADEFGFRTFVTYGTTSGTDDIYPVPQTKVLGRYQFSVPNLGTFFAFLKTPMGYVCCIGIPFLLLLFIQGAGMITGIRRMYREKEEQFTAELADRQKTIDDQHDALQKLQQTVDSLQARLDALEKGKDPPL